MAFVAKHILSQGDGLGEIIASKED